MRRRQPGLTLVELMITLSILAILVTSIDLLPWRDNREGKQTDAVMSEIVSAIAMARHQAVMENVMVTFCPSDDGLHCQGNWHDGSIIFTDGNEDRIMNGDDRLLFRLDPPVLPGELRFNSFRRKQYLQLTPRGMTNHQNGNFTFCPADRDPRLARQVIVSYTARTRFARDVDGDGIVENSRGKPLAC